MAIQSGIKVSHILAIILVAGVLWNCAGTVPDETEYRYPADVNDPFLVLDQVIEGDHETHHGLIQRSLKFLFGPTSGFQLNQPTDVTVDGLGRLLVVDSEGGLIYSYEQENGKWLSLDHIQVEGLLHPLAVASSPTRILVTDLTLGSIFLLDNEFKVLKVIDDASMNRPGDICYDPVGKRFLVVDPPASRVLVIGEDGDILGQLDNDLQRPVSVTSDLDNGTIYVLDALTRKVLQFGTDLSFENSFGEYDQVPGSFAFPKGIALSSDGVIFVADVAFGNVQMFDPSGALLFYFGETGSGRGEFLMPRNLFMDQNQQLYVADPYNSRVQVFQYDAQP